MCYVMLCYITTNTSVGALLVPEGAVVSVYYIFYGLMKFIKAQVNFPHALVIIVRTTRFWKNHHQVPLKIERLESQII